MSYAGLLLRPWNSPQSEYSFILCCFRNFFQRRKFTKFFLLRQALWDELSYPEVNMYKSHSRKLSLLPPWFATRHFSQKQMSRNCSFWRVNVSTGAYQLLRWQLLFGHIAVLYLGRGLWDYWQWWRFQNGGRWRYWWCWMVKSSKYFLYSGFESLSWSRIALSLSLKTKKIFTWLLTGIRT